MKTPWLAIELLLATILVSGVGGCHPRSTGYERYVPSAKLAREALDQVMMAWKNGEPAGPLKCQSSPITIRVADTARRAGQRLGMYEVLGEVSGEGPRTFVVRLKLENPNAEEEAIYYLVGIDPLWVFRQEDYNALVHWDACAREGALATAPRPPSAISDSASRSEKHSE